MKILRNKNKAIRNTKTEMKNAFQRLINRLNMAEVRLSELENTNFRKLEKPRAEDLRN